MPKLLKIIFISLVLFFVAPSEIFATATVRNLGGTMSFTLSNNNPKVGDDVTITLFSSSSNIEKNKIVWAVNENLELEGVGEKEFTVNIATTSPTIVTVTTDDLDGRVATREITIEPADIDLIWETSGFSPFFYDGKTYPSVGSDIIIQAFPEIYSTGQKIPLEMLYFTWTYNNKIIEDQSGWSKNSLRVTSADQTRTNIINLTITDPDKEVSYLTKSLVIPNRGPEFLFYDADEIAGLFYPKAYDRDINFKVGQEKSITAVPFSLGIPLDFISYEWSATGRTQTTENGVNVDLSLFLSDSEATKNVTFTASAINQEFLPLRSFLRIGLE